MTLKWVNFFELPQNPKHYEAGTAVEAIVSQQGGRLLIIDKDTGKTLYCPPDFIRHKDRVAHFILIYETAAQTVVTTYPRGLHDT